MISPWRGARECGTKVALTIKEGQNNKGNPTMNNIKRISLTTAIFLTRGAPSAPAGGRSDTN